MAVSRGAAVDGVRTAVGGAYAPPQPKPSGTIAQLWERPSYGSRTRYSFAIVAAAQEAALAVLATARSALYTCVAESVVAIAADVKPLVHSAGCAWRAYGSAIVTEVVPSAWHAYASAIEPAVAIVAEVVASAHSAGFASASEPAFVAAALVRVACYTFAPAIEAAVEMVAEVEARVHGARCASATEPATAVEVQAWAHAAGCAFGCPSKVAVVAAAMEAAMLAVRTTCAHSSKVAAVVAGGQVVQRVSELGGTISVPDDSGSHEGVQCGAAGSRGHHRSELAGVAVYHSWWREVSALHREAVVALHRETVVAINREAMVALRQEAVVRAPKVSGSAQEAEEAVERRRLSPLSVQKPHYRCSHHAPPHTLQRTALLSSCWAPLDAAKRSPLQPLQSPSVAFRLRWLYVAN